MRYGVLQSIYYFCKQAEWGWMVLKWGINLKNRIDITEMSKSVDIL